MAVWKIRSVSCPRVVSITILRRHKAVLIYLSLSIKADRSGCEKVQRYVVGQGCESSVHDTKHIRSRSGGGAELG